jgi:uncharacterized membrane protein
MRSDRRSYQDGLAFAAAVLALAALSCSRQPRYPAAPQVGSEIVISLASLETDVPRFFTYRYENRNISFFVLKLATGATSYLDACITCYPRRLGYECKDGSVHCRACGMNYSIYKLEKGIGGCYPIKISGRIEDGNYLISLGELRKHTGKF